MSHKPMYNVYAYTDYTYPHIHVYTHINVHTYMYYTYKLTQYGHT